MNSPTCPICGSDMWDQRKSKFWGTGYSESGNPKPIYKCKNRECKGVIWPDYNEMDQRPKAERQNAYQKAKQTMQTSNPSELDARQRAIIRQHSQSMAIEVLKLKQALNQLNVEDLTPAKLRQLADYFDQDVLKNGD